MPTLIFSRFRITEYPDSTGEVREIYNDILNYFPFLPNWFKTQGQHPMLLQGNWSKIKYTLFHGKIPLLLKQMIIFGISRQRDCQYCMAMHSYSVGELSREEGIRDVAKLLNDPEASSIPSSWKTAIRVVNEAAAHPTTAGPHIFEELSLEGYSNEEIIELLSLADLTIMLNTIAEISGIQIDPETGTAN